MSSPPLMRLPGSLLSPQLGLGPLHEGIGRRCRTNVCKSHLPRCGIAKTGSIPPTPSRPGHRFRARGNSSTLWLLSRRLLGRPDEDAEEGRHRNGPARAGLQSQTGHEHHGRRPAERSHERGPGAGRRQVPDPANRPPGTANPGPRDPVRQTDRQNRRHPSDKSSKHTGRHTGKAARVSAPPGPEAEVFQTPLINLSARFPTIRRL